MWLLLDQTWGWPKKHVNTLKMSKLYLISYYLWVTKKLKLTLNMYLIEWLWRFVNNFNIKKIKMKNTIWPKKNSTNYLTTQYDDLIEVKESLRNLGVIMSDDASFTSHVHHVCSKVKQKAGWILRTFQPRTTQVMIVWEEIIWNPTFHC